MLILIYNTILAVGFLILLPILIPLVLLIPKRRRTFFQRMGWYRFPRQKNHRKTPSERIWVHALSVGEVLSAQPLVQQLGERCPDAELFITASTLTGYRTLGRIFGDSSVHLGYFPYDCIWAVRKVCGMVRPTRVVITETDIWPTFMWEMERRKVPVYLVNLRISDRAWKNYKRFRWLSKFMFLAFERICVQTINEQECLTQLSVPIDRIGITGNLKFDGMDLHRMPPGVPKKIGQFAIPEERRIIVAGSTHEGEEAILCEAIGPILRDNTDVAMVIVPRDPDRSLAIQGLCRHHGLDGWLLSLPDRPNGGDFPQVVIVDAIGLLRDIYAIAYISIIGGSMAPYGGHNPLEPAFWGKPVLFGNDMRDFALIADYLVAGGGALRVCNAEHLHTVVTQMLNDPDLVDRMGGNALDIIKTHTGAVERTLSHLEFVK